MVQVSLCLTPLHDLMIYDRTLDKHLHPPNKKKHTNKNLKKYECQNGFKFEFQSGLYWQTNDIKKREDLVMSDVSSVVETILWIIMDVRPI
jgi:hypothetical protein